MTNPIKNNQAPQNPANDPYAKNYGNDPYGQNYGTGGTQPDPYGQSGYDPGMGGDEYGMDGGYGDEFVGEEIEGGDGMGGAPVGSYSAADLREMVNSMKGTLSAEQFASFMGRINASTGMSPEKQEAELAKIASELNMVANPQAGVEGMEGMEGEEGEVSNEAHKKQVDDFKKELEDYRDDVEDMDNLTEEEKTQFLGAIDKMINDIELAEKDPARLAELDIESMKGDLNDLKGGEEGVDAANQHPQSVKALADLAGMTPEELAAKAQAKGIDLSNLSLPPPMELFDFLKEISPELKTKLEAVETAMNERTKFYETNKAAADSIRDSNARSSTDPDNTDTSAWQNLYNVKYHQDEKSKAVMDAMKDVVNTLTPLLEALYPGQDVKPVETSGLSGWEKTHKDYSVADQISIGGTVIDLFNDVDGKIQSSTTLTETEIAIDIPTIAADGEGDGEWSPPKLQTFGEGQVGTWWYKDGG